MSQTTGDYLHDTLKDLTDEPLKQFKSKLCDRTLKPRIRRSEVEKADRLDLVNILISRYTENGAVQVTVNILQSMNCNDLVTDLIESLPGGNSACDSGEKEVEEGGEREGEEEDDDDDDEDDEDDDDDDSDDDDEEDDDDNGEMVPPPPHHQPTNLPLALFQPTEGYFTDVHPTGPFERVSNVDEMVVQFEQVIVIHEEIPVVVRPEWNE